MLSIITIIFIKLTICFCAVVNGQKQSLETNVCTTPACLKAAESITQNMNISKNPCDNFYLFACGKFVKQANVPRGQNYTNPMTIIDNEIKEKLKNDLERNIKDNEPRTHQLLKSYYNACLDSGTKNAAISYDNTIKSILETLGGWPVLKGNDWDESDFDWMNFTENARRLGLKNTSNSFISFGKSVDDKDDKPLMFIDFPITGIDRSYLELGLENEEVNKHYKSMIQLAVFYGAEESVAEEEMKKSLMFEIELAKLEKGSSLSIGTLKEFESLDETVPYLEYLNLFLPKTIEIDSNSTIMVDREVLKSLTEFIDNADKRTMANYALWRVVQELHDVLNTHVNIDIKKQFFVAPGTGHRLSKYCIDYLMKQLPVGMGALYVEKHSNQSSKIAVEEIKANLLKAFKGSIKKSKSLITRTKKTAIKKLQSMKIHVGYPDELVDDKKIEDYFKNLHGPGANFLENHLQLTAFNFDDDLQRTFSEDYYWVAQAWAAHALPFINYKRNSIIINAAVIQKELFDTNVPNYLNYAGIGRVIGHEITHTFDNRGRKYNETGNYSDQGWMERKERLKFNKGKRCLADQYTKYKASKRAIALKGEVTSNENIADHGGITVAYTAYEEWVKQNGEEPVLPGLPYTSRQLFWLNVAHSQCSRIRKTGWVEFLEDDVHSPEPFRVLGSLVNMPDFAKDFNCPAGSRMNPIEKCSFWWNH